MSGILSDAIGALGWASLPSDDTSIEVNGAKISGWESVTLRVSAEVMPWTFELETTEWNASGGSVTIVEGSTCQVFIGGDLVISGYIVTVLRSVEARGHSVRVVGASKSLDLTECSAIFSTYQINDTDAASLIRTLSAPFNIQVKTAPGLPVVAIQQFDVILTETAYEIIERVCRAAQWLVYDAPDGSIMLAQAGASNAASGFTEGRNVENYSCSFSMAGRYQSITAILQTTDSLFESPDTEDLGGQLAMITAVPPVRDPNVMRYRPLLIPAEQNDVQYQVTKQRVQWEVNRRIGRAYSVQLTCDSWRDSAGALWAVNTLAPVSLPTGKCTPSTPWVIVDISFRRDSSGTHADLTLMPRDALLPQPVVLNPLAAPVAQAIRSNAYAAPTPGPIDQETLPVLTAPGAS